MIYTHKNEYHFITCFNLFFNFSQKYTIFIFLFYMTIKQTLKEKRKKIIFYVVYVYILCTVCCVLQLLLVLNIIVVYSILVNPKVGKLIEGNSEPHSREWLSCRPFHRLHPPTSLSITPQEVILYIYIHISLYVYSVYLYNKQILNLLDEFGFILSIFSFARNCFLFTIGMGPFSPQLYASSSR